MKIKRTTAVPQIYHETSDIKNVSNLPDILKRNREINTRMMSMSEQADYKLQYDQVSEIEYYVPKLFDFITLNNDVLLTIYDTPGLNDSRTRDVYYQYINNNFNKFDVIIFLLDINSAMNTSDENDILKMLITNIKNNKDKYNIDTNLIVLLNKCDDMVFNKKTKKYELDEELQDMFNQANAIIQSTCKEIYSDFKYSILPISCENSYIYRMYKRNPTSKLDEKHLNKFGSNEFGKSRWNRLDENEKLEQIHKLFKKFDYNDRISMSGFLEFKNTMQNMFSSNNQYLYIMNHLKYEIQQNTSVIQDDIMNYLDKLDDIQKKLYHIVQNFNKAKSELAFFYKAIDGYFMLYRCHINQNVLPQLGLEEKYLDKYVSILNNFQKYNYHSQTYKPKILYL
jgi:hypothetical protein